MSDRDEQEEAIGGMENARVYAASHRKYAGLMYGSLVKDIEGLNLSGRYLEMGAGPGYLAMMIAERKPDSEITAVDISSDMIAVAGEFIREKKLENRVHYIQGDVGDEQFMQKLGTFDLVYTTFSLHHWKDPDESIRNLWNAVRPGGALYILDFRRIGWLCSLPVRWREMESLRASYGSREVESIFQRTGLTDFRIKTSFPYLLQTAIAWK